jgi:hypothetical protein
MSGSLRFVRRSNVYLFLVVNASNAATLQVGPTRPYATISDALLDADPGDTISVDPGTYDEAVEVTEPVDIVSVGGSGVTRVLNSGAGPIFDLHADALVEGFELDCAGTERAIAGAAGLGSLRIVDVAAHDCAAGGNGRGGALFVRDGFLEVEDSTFDANSADEGGAILVDGVGPVVIRNSTFTNNSAPDGAAVYTDFDIDAVTITGSTFDQNIGGAAVLAWFPSTATIRTSSFTNNPDGGLNVNGADAIFLTGSTFCGNEGILGGGAHLAIGGAGTIKVVDNVFVDNRVTGLFSNGGGLSVEGFTYYELAKLVLLDNTFALNDGDGAHVGVYFQSKAKTSKNNIFAFARAGNASWSQERATNVADYNLWFGNAGGDRRGVNPATASGPNDVLADPLFAALSDNGNCFDDDLSLAPGSPAIDAGDPARLDDDGSISDIGAAR